MSIMLEMKTKTALCHSKTEQLLRNKLFSAPLSSSAYGDVLGAFYKAYSSLESAIAAYPLTSELLQKRSKLELLKKDLVYLRNGAQANESYIFTGDSPKVASEAVALGVLYVMEGSTLGGKIITSHLAKYEWMNVDLIGNFFNNYGDERGRMWAEFGHVINRFSRANSFASDHLVCGAKITFDYIYSLLAQVR